MQLDPSIPRGYSRGAIIKSLAERLLSEGLIQSPTRGKNLRTDKPTHCLLGEGWYTRGYPELLTYLLLPEVVDRNGRTWRLAFDITETFLPTLDDDILLVDPSIFIENLAEEETLVSFLKGDIKWWQPWVISFLPAREMLFRLKTPRGLYQGGG